MGKLKYAGLCLAVASMLTVWPAPLPAHASADKPDTYSITHSWATPTRAELFLDSRNNPPLAKISAVSQIMLDAQGNAIIGMRVSSEYISVVSYTPAGEQRWSTDLFVEDAVQKHASNVYIQLSPDGQIYVLSSPADGIDPSLSNSVYVMDAATGELLWDKMMAQGDSCDLQPALSGGAVIGCKKFVYKLDAAGELQSKFTLPGSRHNRPVRNLLAGLRETSTVNVTLGTLLTVEGYGYTGQDVFLHLFNDDGERRYTVNLSEWYGDNAQKWLPKMLVLSDQSMALIMNVPGSKQTVVHYVSSGGELLWTRELPERTPIFASGDRIYYMTADAVALFNREDGQDQARFEASSLKSAYYNMYSGNIGDPVINDYVIAKAQNSKGTSVWLLDPATLKPLADLQPADPKSLFTLDAVEGSYYLLQNIAAMTDIQFDMRTGSIYQDGIFGDNHSLEGSRHFMYRNRIEHYDVIGQER
ncbi:hypothetical protein [Paenibacillus thalictri]|uniref:PQQ-binding-like beta-propeller repeat protein n=1 Tax=Paenibacillus thalictri TaxID=2527873 RepID=A0A4Q9DP93_9BACL|nr:hypothetical protein [Paenibacillus thalictri]TBL76038.1 hypothetical protein EYB31_21030 [Paenibacillus thalictri]